MWIKKTEQEIATESRCQRVKILPPLVYALVIVGFALIYYCFKVGGLRFGFIYSSRSLSEVWEHRRWFFLLFGLTFVVFSLIQVIFPRSRIFQLDAYHELYLCLNCNKFHHKNLNICPDCNNILIAPENYKWVEKEPGESGDR